MRRDAVNFITLTEFLLNLWLGNAIALFATPAVAA